MSSEESKQNNKEQNTGFNPFGSFPAELSNQSNTNTTSNQQSGQNGFEGFTFSDNIFASFPTALSQPSNNNDTSSTEQNTSFTFTFTDNSFSQPQEEKIENKESKDESNKSESEPASNDGTNIFSSFPAAFTTTSNNSPQNTFGSFTFTDPASKQADDITNSTEQPEISKENDKPSEKDEQVNNQETKQENLFASFPAALTKPTNSDIESSHLNQQNELGSFVFNDTSIQQKSETKEDEVTKTSENDLSTPELAKSSTEDTIKETNDEVNDNSKLSSQSSNTSNKDDAFSSFPAAFSKSSSDNSTDKHNPFAFTDPTTNNSQQNQSDNNETIKPESNNKISHQQSSSDDEQPNLFASFPAALSKASSNPEQSSHNEFGSFTFSESTTSKQNEDQQNNLTLSAQSSNQQANDDIFASFPGNITTASQNKSSDLFSDFAFSDSFAKTGSDVDAAKKEESKEDIFSSFAAALSSSSSNQVMDSNNQNESFTFTDNSPKLETPSIEDPAITKEETSKEIDHASKDSDVNDQEKKQDDFFSAFPAAFTKSSSNSNSTTPNNSVSFTDFPAKEEGENQSIEKDQENDKSSSSADLSPKSSSQQDDFFSSFPAAFAKSSSNSTTSNPVVFNDLPTKEEGENQSIEKVQEDLNPKSSSQHEDFFSSFPAAFSTPTKNETESEEPKSPKEEKEDHENIQLETQSSNKETESLPNDLQSHSQSESFGEFSFSETPQAASNPFVSPTKETTPKSDTQQEKQGNQSNNDDSLEKIEDNDEPKGNFTFSFTPSFESNKDAESNKDNEQKIDTSINMEDFKGFSFTPAEGDASFGNFTFTFPTSNETANNDTNSLEQDKPSVSFGDFHPFEGFTFTPATPAQNEEIVNKAEEQTTEQEQPSKPKRKPRSVNTSSVSFGDNIDSKEEDTYQSVAIGDYSFSAFQNLINNPIFKLAPTDVTNYFDANDETNTIDGALNYLKSHTVQ